MYGYGRDIRVCVKFQKQCHICSSVTQFDLIEKSDDISFFGIPFRFNRNYHLICRACSNIFSISEENRKKIYLTLWERYFRH